MNITKFYSVMVYLEMVVVPVVLTLLEGPEGPGRAVFCTAAYLPVWANSSPLEITNIL